VSRTSVTAPKNRSARRHHALKLPWTPLALRPLLPGAPRSVEQPGLEGLGSPIGSSANSASMGFLSPTTYSNKGSYQHRVYVDPASWIEPTPGCDTPPGFLNLLTSCSTLVLSALFHAESVHGVEALRGFPLPVAVAAFTASCPSSHMHRSVDSASAPLRGTTHRP